jgi:hypothetical protein
MVCRVIVLRRGRTRAPGEATMIRNFFGSIITGQTLGPRPQTRGTEGTEAPRPRPREDWPLPGWLGGFAFLALRCLLRVMIVAVIHRE